MTSPQIVLGRRITFNDPLLDSLYESINSHLYAKQIDRPFQWEEVDGTYMLFVYDTVRFVRHSGHKYISCEEFNSQSLKWEPCVSADQHMPVMWPIKSATASSVYAINENKVGSVVQKKVEEFYAIHPNYRENKELNKKIHHLAFVCEKKWQHRCRKSQSQNLRGAVRFWWANFVDRSVFKSLVSVVGSQTAFPITWKHFADLTVRDDLNQIQSNIEGLGSARKLLAALPYEKWATASLKTIMPSTLLTLWNQIQEEPLSVQTVFVTPSAGQWHSLNLDKVWSMYDLFKSASNQWNSRELNMIVTLAENYERSKGLSWEAPSTKLDVKSVVPYIHTCVKLWRRTYPDNYKKWSKASQTQWLQQSRTILENSCAHQEFSVPSLDSFEDLKSNHEKHILETVLKENGVSLMAKTKRRAM